jgi:hypothetical protein
MQKADLEEESRQRLEVEMLGSQLFWDRRGDARFYPHEGDPCDNGVETSASWSESPDDPDKPSVILIKLESTSSGCRYLLDRWAELRELLRPGQCWHSPDKFKAVRLVGKHPLDVPDEPKLGQIFLASQVVNPEYPGPFHELEIELPS